MVCCTGCSYKNVQKDRVLIAHCTLHMAMICLMFLSALTSIILILFKAEYSASVQGQVSSNRIFLGQTKDLETENSFQTVLVSCLEFSGTNI